MGNNKKEEELKEPKMPDVRVPEDFLKKIVDNRVNYAANKKKIKQQREKK
jgi:hypothetical protein